MPLAGNDQARPLLATSFSELDPQFSPDGKWFAYTSNESGRPEIYVQSFPPGSRKWRVSSEGGGTPRWRGDGREIYFENALGVYASSVAIKGNGLVFGAPQKLFENADKAGVLGAAFGLSARFAVTRDGQHFAIISGGASDYSAIRVLLGWRPQSVAAGRSVD